MVAAVQIMSSSELTTPIRSLRTTATVREHTCLFTHDLRRKQKRWKDGRLKYHTFNKRVMVYDDRGHFVGDAHWQEDYDLADGDDLELERGGIVVQIGECVEKHEQDLSELIDKRAQERAQRQAAAAVRRSSVAFVATPNAAIHAVRPQTLPKRHLHDVIGTPSGHHGRAVLPTESPYEERQRGQTLQADGPRPSKRQRKEISPPSKNGYAQSLFGATLTLSGRPSTQASVRHHPSKTSHTRTAIAAPLSPSTSNHNVQSRSTIDLTQTQDALGHSSNQKSVQSNPARISMTALSRHGMIRPENPQYAKSGILDEPEKRSITQRLEPELIVDREKAMTNKRSIHDSQRVTRKTGGNKIMQRTDAKISPSSELPTTEVSTKRIRGSKRPDTGSGFAQGDRPPISKSVDFSGVRIENPHKSPAPDEPRTELKIKPRKKRGLLMVNEPDVTRLYARDSPSAAETHCADVPTDRSEGKTDSTNTEHNYAEVSKLRKIRNIDDGNNDNVVLPSSYVDNARYLAGDDEFDGMEYVDQSCPKLWEEAKPRAVVEQGNRDGTENTLDTGRQLRSKEQVSSKIDISLSGLDDSYGRSALSEMQDNAPIRDIPPPRLASLGRRGTRSREVIGLVLDDGPYHQKSNLTSDNLAVAEAQPDDEFESRDKGLLAAKGSSVPQRQDSGTSESAANAANRIVQGEETESIATATSTTKQPISAINNPATRGKKAAKPSDAASKMPVCPIPMESAARQLRHQTPKRMNIQGPPERTESPLPGFSRANGGPWSREAYDLFDFRRPP